MGNTVLDVVLLIEGPKMMWFLQIWQRPDPHGCVPGMDVFGCCVCLVLTRRFPRFAVRLSAMSGLDGSTLDMRSERLRISSCSSCRSLIWGIRGWYVVTNVTRSWFDCLLPGRRRSVRFSDLTFRKIGWMKDSE